jgi:DNA-binding IclR family transcriptional regulator
MVAMEELVSEMSALGLSKSYTEGLVKELVASGILKRVRGGAYTIDVEALGKALKEVE